MTIDERLEFLVHSTESLHAAMAEANERIDKEREERKRAEEAFRTDIRRHHLALVKAMQAYLDAMTEGGAHD